MKAEALETAQTEAPWADHLEKNCRWVSHVELRPASFSGSKTERQKSELKSSVT